MKQSRVQKAFARARWIGPFHWLWAANAAIVVILSAYCAVTGCSSNNQPAQPPPPSGPNTPGILYASPQGLPTNDGSASRPLDLATALSSGGPARPGQTIYLRGGTYRGPFTSTVNGRSDAPIIVRASPGERAVLDAVATTDVLLVIQGSYTTFWGLEFTSSAATRSDTGQPSTPSGIYTRESSGIKLINNVVHDLPGQGMGVWSESIGAEVYGNIIFHNGTNHFDHGIYTQNENQTKRIEDNVIFGQASHGIHGFGSSSASLDHFVIVGNISFDNGLLVGDPERNLLVGGGRIAHDLTVTDNFTYYAPGGSHGSNNLGYAAGCADATVTNNTFVGGNALTLVNCVPTTFTGNTLVGSMEPPDLPLVYPNGTYESGLPHGLHTAVRPNRYEPGRAHIVVYNWDLATQVPVDLSPSGLRSGQAFEIRDVQSLFDAPVVTGTFTGAPVTLPMTGLRTTAPVWNRAVAPRHTAPEFAVFIVIPR